MRFKIGLVMVGFSCFTCLLSGFLLQIFKEELMAWSPTPPAWIWIPIAGIFIFGMIGFIIAFTAER